MNASLQQGDLVKASYKTGQYIGKVVEINNRKAAVQVLGVVRHPTQGDLHNPMDPDVGFFHQRPALAFNEIALMPLDDITLYKGEVPDYRQSLQRALENEMEFLSRTARFAERCLQEFETLKKDYRL
jgi:kinase-associated protein B